jgi:flagellum-specific ATP synthase
VRGTLDGHIVLSREIANAGRYPAVDVLKSISRLHAAVATPEHLAAGLMLIEQLSVFERNRQLVEIGAYKPGSNPTLDRAVVAMPAIQAFLSQPMGQRVDRASAIRQLHELVAAVEREHDR